MTSIKCAFLALGSNMGDRAQHLRSARDALHAQPSVSVTSASKIIETPALLPEGASPSWDKPFMNQVVSIDTTLAPRDLLTLAKAIETRLGRGPGPRWAPRVIDIDVLAVEDTVVSEDGLTVPHPELANRLFVLKPWREIAPDWRHPILGRTIAELCAALEANGEGRAQ